MAQGDNPGVRAIRGALAWVDGAFVRDRTILVEGGRIAGVVPSGATAPGIPVEDWGEVAILPGSVNCHGHAFQNLFKGFADDLRFERWRDDVLYPFSERLDASAIYTGALFAFAEALLAGATTTVDFFYLHDAEGKNQDAVLRAARDIGIRLVFARAFYDDDAPTKAPASYREPAAEAAARLEELAGSVRGDDLISVQPAPHSLHAVSPDTLAVALDVAGHLDVPCHLHLAEASYEVEQVRARYGTTPVRLLQREGLLTDRLVAVHGVWLDDEELDMMADAGSAIVHCPGANAFLGDGIARLPEMLERGVRVGLGPDGGCANNKQSVFEEMRLASLFAKARLTDGSALDAPTALDLGTRAGGDVLGLPVGSLAEGAYADLVALDLADVSLQPLATLERQIVNSMRSTAIDKVMVGGEVVVSDGALTRVDRADLNRRIAAVTEGWTRPD